MKCLCEKQELQSAVSTVSRLVAARATLPVLQAIYLEAKEGTLLLRTTDLEQTTEVRVSADVQAEGSIAVPARTLNEYLQGNSDATITVEALETTVQISSVNHKAKIKSFPGDEYPTPPQIRELHTFTIATSSFRQAVEKCLFAVSTDDSRPILTGVLLRCTRELITFVATDGYRLAMSKLDCATGAEGDYIFPRKALSEVVKLGSAGELEVIIGENQARISSGSTTITARLLEGVFPNYQSILPKEEKIVVTVSASALLQSLRLASIFSRDSAYSTKLELKDKKLRVTAISPSLGDNTNEVPVESGESFELSINAQYLIDVLQNVSSDVVLKVIDQKSPVVVMLPGNEHYLYLVMPLRNE